MTVSAYEGDNGPDGLGRIHRLLAAIYGVEIPSRDYHAVVVLLDALGLSLRGIVEMMRRFTGYPVGRLINDVNGLMSGEIPVPEVDVFRVKQLFAAEGFDELLGEELPKWISGPPILDPRDPGIPVTAMPYWAALLRVFPRGVRTPKDYVTTLAVLQDEEISSTDTQILVSKLILRPTELIARDIEELGTALIVSEADKVSLKRELGLARSDDSGS